MNIPAYLQSDSAKIQHKSQMSGNFLATLKTYQHTNQQEAVLSVINVNKFFDQLQVLDNIHLELKAGEFISFLGPSGCGKTTLLRIIAGLEQPDHGQLIKKDVNITKLAAAKRKCGVVFQNYALFPNLTVAENIAFGLNKKQHTKNEIAERVQSLLALIELPQIAEKYPNQLSGGQQQRVALARAIANKPDILLLDEPLSALDAQVRLNLRQKIKLIQSQLNLPTIMVTHDQEEALSISDRVVVMNHGLIEQVDTPHNIYYQPLTLFVAQFIGNMNFITAHSQSENELCIFNHCTIRLSNKNFKPKHRYTLGFRPEVVEFVDNHSIADENFIYVPIKISSTEFLGAKIRLFCQINFSECPTVDLQIEVDHGALKNILSEMLIKVPIALVHIFDEQGRALC